MSTIHRLPDTDRVTNEAGDWIARLNSDEVTAEERAAFAAWREAHPSHARAYEQLSATWREFREAGRIVRAVSFGDAMNAAAESRARRSPWPAVAAALAVVGLIGVYALRSTSATQFQTAIGEHAAIQLPDGSSLELNSNSLANVEYTKRARVIRLKRGEAFFKVAHDVQRPFWVAAGTSWVRAVGTAFSVYISPTDVRVVVSEGVVKVAADQARDDTPTDAVLARAPVSVLTAGQQAQMRRGSADIRLLKEAELARSLAWRQGTLNFDNQPLGVAIEELGRYTPMEIVVEDPVLRQLPVGGTFQANPDGAEALLAMLEDGLGLRVRRNGEHRVYIEGEPRK